MYIHWITTLLCLSTYAITSTSLVISSSPAASLSTTNTVTVNSTTTNPATTNPASTNPATIKPASTNPASTNPATTNLASTNPAFTNPATTNPATTNPATTNPAFTNPAPTNPATTRPAATPSSTALRSKTTKLIKNSILVTNITAITQANNVSYSTAVGETTTRAINNTATTGFESSNEMTGTVTLSSDGKIYNISATTTQIATFPDVVQCDVTQEMCEHYGYSDTSAWHITCYKYGDLVRLCSSICSMKKREPRCTDYCPDYKAACIHITSSLVPTTPQRGERFPDVVRCDVTWEMCERYGDSPTTAWNTTCFKYGESIRPCSSICSMKKREPRCTDYCPDYKAACIWLTSTTSLVPTTHQSGERFPYVLQCDVTQDTCERYADSKTSAWNITCFADRRLEETTIRLCSSICLSENDGKRVKCSENCPDFRSQCVEETTQPKLPSTSVATTAEAKNTFPYVLQCDVTQHMCVRYADSKTSAWNITCFADENFGQERIRLCKPVCHPVKKVICGILCPEINRGGAVIATGSTYTRTVADRGGIAVTCTDTAHPNWRGGFTMKTSEEVKPKYIEADRQTDLSKEFNPDYTTPNHLRCADYVTGNPLPDSFSWTRQGSRLQETSSTLNLAAKPDGTEEIVTCVASNGLVEKNITITWSIKWSSAVTTNPTTTTTPSPGPNISAIVAGSAVNVVVIIIIVIAVVFYRKRAGLDETRKRSWSCLLSISIYMRGGKKSSDNGHDMESLKDRKSKTKLVPDNVPKAQAPQRPKDDPIIYADLVHDPPSKKVPGQGDREKESKLTKRYPPLAEPVLYASIDHIKTSDYNVEPAIPTSMAPAPPPLYGNVED